MKQTPFCAVCGAICSGKLKVEARKGTYYDFCVVCFNAETELKNLRAKIKKRNI